MISIYDFFKNSSFTLRDLCLLQINLLKKYKNNSYIKYNNNNNIENYNYIKDICYCYLNFTNNDKKYLNYLVNTRFHNGNIYYNYENNINTINFKQILQEFDEEFNKLVIRIRTQKNNNIISVEWNKYDETFPYFKKEILKKYFESLE